jgi:hypothetical protein
VCGGIVWGGYDRDAPGELCPKGVCGLNSVRGHFGGLFARGHPVRQTGEKIGNGIGKNSGNLGSKFVIFPMQDRCLQVTSKMRKDRQWNPS